MTATQQQIDRRKSVLMRQSEVDYVTVSPETGSRQCANCRFFCPAGSYSPVSSDVIPVAACMIVEQYPLSILPTGFCNRHEILPEDANEMPPMEVTIVEVDADVERSYIAPEPAKAPLLKRLFGAKDPPATTFLRDSSGARLAVIVTSNGYKDREAEHVATKALQEYVESQFKDGAWHGDNVLDFYHWHPLDIGDIVAAAVLDGFLVEVAKERTDSPIAGLVWDYWQKTAEDGSVVWGASHEFQAKRDGDTFVRIKKSRTSVLDIHDAANLYTYSGVLNMSKETEHMDKVFGFEGAAIMLRDKGINAVNDELRKRGIVAKGADKSEGGAATGASGAAALPPGSVIDWTPLFSQLIDTADEHQKTIDAQAQELTALKSLAETRQKAADTTAGTLKTVQDEVAALKKQLADFKADTPRRASEDEATRLSGEEEKKAREEIEKRTTKYDPAFPGMNVPLKEAGV
jgi:hypothetical protein